MAAHVEPGPDHPITISPSAERVVITVAGTVVADSRAALALQEADYPAVLYLPRADVNEAVLQRNEHSTHCPYKGDATYFSLVRDDEVVADVAWSYEEPYPAVEQIRDHLAFYPERVSIDRG